MEFSVGATHCVQCINGTHRHNEDHPELGVIASFGVSQWAEARVKCVLKGGNPAPTLPETEILLKGYIAGRSAGSEM